LAKLVDLQRTAYPRE